MNNEEILRKAIEKAIKNGYPPTWGYPMFNLEGKMVSPDYNVIYSHDFAKAFFGGQDYDYYIEDIHAFSKSDLDLKEGRVRGKAWQYHLQQMVITEDPIKYLEKYL